MPTNSEPKSKSVTASSPLSDLIRLNPDQKRALSKIGIHTIHDLLYYFPARYGNNSEAVPISQAEEGAQVMLIGTISNLKTAKTFRTKTTMAEGVLQDETGSIKLVWFHQPYIAKMLQEGAAIKVEGKVSKRNTELYLSNPKVEKMITKPGHIGTSLFNEGEIDHEFTLYPVYPETKGITSNWIYHTIQKVFRAGVLDTMQEIIPESILSAYKLPSFHSALIWVHSPKKIDDAETARKRFAFEEIFLIQLHKMQERALREKEESILIKPDLKNLDNFLKQFPFKPTEGQMSAINEIVKDLEAGKSMSRLLEGDVGSGKTLVAASAVAVTTKAGFQVAYMAPTEILAKQHFYSFISYFKHAPQAIGLLTGSGCFKFPSKIASRNVKDEYGNEMPGITPISKPQLLKWIKSGEIPVVIGTHALIQKNVAFKRLGLVIIDEQHRFGTAQRQKLAQKSDEVVAKQAKDDTRILKESQKQKVKWPIPHLLSMTATPIPRTLALTVYGDLDISIIDAMPVGRKPVITEIVAPGKRDAVYKHIVEQLRAGRQVYVICPRINEPDPDKEGAINAKSVIMEAERLRLNELKGWKIDILHSKMSPKEKDDIMQKFATHKIDVLVATSVVEVGVNVPNATNIIIEGGERFGLSQLHQLRGRVIRSNDQAYCFVCTESKSDKTIERLRALKTAKNGFELSELDLKMRGAGDLYGQKQWGVTDLGMEAIKNIKLVEAARNEAKKVIAADLYLDTHPLLKEKLETRKNLHLE